MGLMRFTVPRMDLLPSDALSFAYFYGRDDVPWQARFRLTENSLEIERLEHDSGRLAIAWHVPGHGNLMLSTATLPERPRLFNLPLELGRGTLNRLRSQVAAWECGGHAVPPDIRAAIHLAVASFAKAATAQHDDLQCANLAQESIIRAVDAISLFGQFWAKQTNLNRKAQAQRSIPLFGVDLGRWRPQSRISQLLEESFNTVSIPLVWKSVEGLEGKFDWTRYDAQFEWCQATGVRVCAGPLLNVDQRALPDWLYLWEGDFDNLSNLMCEYIRTVVSRYRNKVHLWHAAAGLDIASAISLNDQQRMRLMVRSIEATRNADPRTPILVSFGAPWGEFVAKRDTDLSPLAFADTLIRAELGIAGIGLYLGPCASNTFRDEFEVSRLIDRWSQLGLPLVIWLDLPSLDAPNASAETCSQVAWANRYIPILLAKPMVHGIFWNQFRDYKNADQLTSGLFDCDGNRKPVMKYLSEIKRSFLS